jgi:micrococcal nuclease
VARRHRIRTLLVAVALGGAAVACGAAGEGAGPGGGAGVPAGSLPDGRDVVVTSITDGDTFRAGDERVRLIGVDTPEVSGGVECFGREATAALERLIPVGSRVRLVADVEARDRYDRTLAYVHRLPDGEMANLALARDGYALPLTVPPNVAHEEAFAAAAAEARDAGRGLWSACDGDLDLPPPTTGASSTAVPPTGAGRDGGDGDRSACDPSYPEVCIPPAPPDLDCGDIAARDIRVEGDDPHRLDGDGDGRGCTAG